jgi:phage terminase small subunit
MSRPHPKWLQSIAKKKYAELIKQYPPLNQQQEDLLAMACNEWETYQSMSDDLQKFADQNGSLMLTLANGSAQPHPSFRMQQAALNAHLKVLRALNQSLLKTPDTDDEPDDTLTDLMGDS